MKNLDLSITVWNEYLAELKTKLEAAPGKNEAIVEEDT